VTFCRGSGLPGTVTEKSIIAFTKEDPWCEVIWSDGREEVFPESALVKITDEEYTARAMMGEQNELSDIDDVLEWAESLSRGDV
jgi:hypothetical protein